MTLLEEIQAKCPELLVNPNCHTIAATLNVGRVKAVSKIGGIGTVLDTLGLINGALLLDSLETMAATLPEVKWE